VKFFVEGAPVPLARARFALVEGKVRTYTPKESAAYEERIALVARGAVARARGWERDARFAVTLFVYDDRRNYDLDNLVKAVLDGLTKAKTVWVDDRRVDGITAHRLPQHTREESRLSGGVEVCVEPLPTT
jgi:Holliday junction resolvase RusA-like endonuclease